MKGYHVALDAMKLLIEKEIHFHYKIIGARGSEELLFHVHDLGLTNHVELTDWVAFQTGLKEISEADILLVSSISEGISNTAIEAMAVGTLVISTNCGGMAELIAHQVNGLLVPIRDENAIAEAIIAVKEMSVQAKVDMAQRAREKVERDFDLQRNAEKFEQFYSTCLQN